MFQFKKPFNRHANLAQVIQHFTPNWFAVTMGTGITAICLSTLARFSLEIKSVATAIWIINIVLFSVFTLAFIARGVCYPSSWLRMLKHSIQPMFLGCIPMGLATIVNGIILLVDLSSSPGAVVLATNLWWIDVGLSILSVIIVPYFMFRHHDHNLANMTGVWLLPFVACEVAAASAGLLLPHLANDTAVIVLVVAIVLWAISVSLALGILVTLFQRLVLHSLPQGELGATMWLPLGPTGTGALAMFLLGSNSKEIVLAGLSHEYQALLNILPGASMLIGICFWALATWWLVIALFATMSYMRRQLLGFNLGFWGYTFPLGVYTMATVNFAKLTGFGFLTDYAIALVITLGMIWAVLFVRTMNGAYHGHLIKDPTINA